VSADDVLRVAADLFRDDRLAVTMVGPEPGAPITPDRLRI
jgi:hypothetical protein